MNNRENESHTTNAMCLDCIRLGNDCPGNSCQVWTGCVYKQKRNDVKTICKPKLIYQPATPDHPYNVQLWHSYDGGETFWYAGYGRFFDDYYEAEAWRKQQRKNLAYDLMFGRLGNGTTVFNCARMEHGDYQTVAHIDDCGAIRWYVDVEKLPPYATKEVNVVALRNMEQFKEKFLRLDRFAALCAVYDTFPIHMLQDDVSQKTVEELYETYMKFTCQRGYIAPEQ